MKDLYEAKYQAIDTLKLGFKLGQSYMDREDEDLKM